MRIHFSLIVLFMSLMCSEVLSQTAGKIVLPKEIDGSVQLDISNITDFELSESSSEYLSVFVKNETEEYASNAIQGKYTIDDGHLTFTPYFPFERGITYEIRTRNQMSEERFYYQSFRIGEKQPLEKAEVLNIYPLSDSLPENLLRFYIYFNTPMKKGQALQHIHLTDNEGRVINRVFMEFKQELWSPDGKRLTILFDPGRIKRGVSTNLELGPALLEGGTYQLVISEIWQDVYGQELAVSASKKFSVVHAYRDKINLDELDIQKPSASRDPLRIRFDRIMDHSLVQSMIRIEDKEHQIVAGSWKISQGEKIVQFVPEKDWKAGTYHIVMNSNLEDVSGNNLNNLLDQKRNDNERVGQQEIIRTFRLQAM